MVYMANCNGPCSSVNSNSLEWFKIAQTGDPFFGSLSVVQATHLFVIFFRPNLRDSGVKDRR